MPSQPGGYLTTSKVCFLILNTNVFRFILPIVTAFWRGQSKCLPSPVQSLIDVENMAASLFYIIVGSKLKLEMLLKV